jgi:tRNA pseudouridine55 synthase
VERAAREINVSVFTLTSTDEATVWRFDVECSVGTYVRVLLSDLAQRLGTLGHLVELRRVASGSHHVEDAMTLDALSVAVEEGRDVLAPPATFVTALEHATLSDDQARAMRRGQRVTIAEMIHGDEVAALDGNGELIGVLQRRDDSWKPELVLTLPAESTRG